MVNYSYNSFVLNTVIDSLSACEKTKQTNKCENLKIFSCDIFEILKIRY